MTDTRRATGNQAWPPDDDDSDPARVPTLRHPNAQDPACEDVPLDSGAPKGQEIVSDFHRGAQIAGLAAAVEDVPELLELELDRRGDGSPVLTDEEEGVLAVRRSSLEGVRLAGDIGRTGMPALRVVRNEEGTPVSVEPPSDDDLSDYSTPMPTTIRRIVKVGCVFVALLVVAMIGGLLGAELTEWLVTGSLVQIARVAQGACVAIVLTATVVGVHRFFTNNENE